MKRSNSDSVFSEAWLQKLLEEGQHSVIGELPHKLNIPSGAKKATQPDTEIVKALKRATRNRLQDAFFHTWQMLGGAADYWQTEYKFHPDRKWRFDFANPDSMIAVEVNGGTRSRYIRGADGKSYMEVSGHVSNAGLQRDAEKLNAAQLFGWRVYVLTTSMLGKREAHLHVGKILQEVING